MAKFLEIVDLYINLNISGNVFQTHVTFFVCEIGALFYETAVFNKSVHKTGPSDSFRNQTEERFYMTDLFI